MGINMSAFLTRINRLREQERRLKQEYERKILEIKKEISEEEEALAKINEILSPYLCEMCGGSGDDTFIDAAGSIDHRKCKNCRGTGVRIE